MRVWYALVLLWALSLSAAQAHAYVVGTQPPANDSYQRPAGEIAISFDEPVQLPDPNAVQVFDSHEKRADDGDAAIDPKDATRVIVHVPRRLEPGVYTVRWRVVSADTHVVHGAYRIGVGVTVTPGALSEAASLFDPSDALASLLRSLSLLGALLAAGAIFLRWYLLDRLEAAYPGGIASGRRAAIAGALVLLAVAIPSLIVQASAVSGVLGQDIGATLFHTSWGAAFLIRLGAAVVVLVVAIFGWEPLKRIAFVAIVVVLATFTASGHALAQSSLLARAIAVAVDFAHLTAAAAWIGGIFILATMLWPVLRYRDAKTLERTRALFAGFTPLAIVCVGVIVVSGAYASVIHVGRVGDLVASVYGRVLLAKIAVVIALLLLGRRHLRIGVGRSAARGAATLGYEALAGFIVVLLTGFLVGQFPPAPPSLMVSAMPLDFVSVHSVAMWPTLQMSDVVVVDRMAYRLHGPRDGEIAVFSPPVEFGGKTLAERVIGVPGDEITILDGLLYRNGTALHEPYEQGPFSYDLMIRNYGIYVDGRPLERRANVPPRALWQAPNRIPEGFYLMLGDNRNYAYDSHIWGFAQSAGFVGATIAVIWPLSRLHAVHGAQ